jgi:hypothetical protein
MLTEEQILILKTLVNCIIPADDFPNGWDAGVGDYLFKQFDGDLKDSVTHYQDGLSSLGDESQVIYGKEFASLSVDDQTALLTQIEKGQVKANWGVDPAIFFTMAVDHCMEGYYSDSGNGGNCEGISWQMIGFEVTNE